MIIEMPEEYIIYRNYFEGIGLTDEWRRAYQNLSIQELKELHYYTHSNNFKDLHFNNITVNVGQVLEHYLIKKDIGDQKDLKEVRKKYNSLIKKDQFIELTLTYDFENENISKLRKASMI